MAAVRRFPLQLHPQLDKLAQGIHDKHAKEEPSESQVKEYIQNYFAIQEDIAKETKEKSREIKQSFPGRSRRFDYAFCFYKLGSLYYSLSKVAEKNDQTMMIERVLHYYFNAAFFINAVLKNYCYDDTSQQFIDEIKDVIKQGSSELVEKNKNTVTEILTRVTEQERNEMVLFLGLDPQEIKRTVETNAFLEKYISSTEEKGAEIKLDEKKPTPLALQNNHSTSIRELLAIGIFSIGSYCAGYNPAATLFGMWATKKLAEKVSDCVYGTRTPARRPD